MLRCSASRAVGSLVVTNVIGGGGSVARTELMNLEATTVS